MALPDALKKTLENALIPLQGIGYASFAIATVVAVGAQFSPHKWKLEEIGVRTSGLSLGSMLAVMGIQAILLRDERKRLEFLRRQYPWVESIEPESNRVMTSERQIEPTIFCKASASSGVSPSKLIVMFQSP